MEFIFIHWYSRIIYYMLYRFFMYVYTIYNFNQIRKLQFEVIYLLLLIKF